MRKDAIGVAATTALAAMFGFATFSCLPSTNTEITIICNTIGGVVLTRAPVSTLHEKIVTITTADGTKVFVPSVHCQGFLRKAD